MPKKTTPASKKTLSKSEQRRIKVMKETKKKTNPKKSPTLDSWVTRSEETGDKVFLILGEQRRWITNPFTLRELGFDFSDVVGIEYEQLLEFPEFEPIDLTPPGSINPLTNKKSKGLPQIKLKTLTPRKKDTPQPAEGTDTSTPHKIWV